MRWSVPAPWLVPAAALAGVAMIGLSFAINDGPPKGVTVEELRAFGAAHHASIVWGAWLQTVGTTLLSAFAIVLAQRSSNVILRALVIFGVSILAVVNFIEVTFYLTASSSTVVDFQLGSLDAIHAVQHLYFIVAAPAVFLPLGSALRGSPGSFRVLGNVALLLGGVFFVLGLLTLTEPELPPAVTALGSLQAAWWVAAAVLFARQCRTTPTGIGSMSNDQSLSAAR